MVPACASFLESMPFSKIFVRPGAEKKVLNLGSVVKKKACKITYCMIS